jgi:hypothetical protein
LTAQAEFLDQLLEPEPPPRRRWPYVALALVVVAAGGLGVASVLTRDEGPTEPPHPAAWDKRVQKYVDFVEKARDLEFEQPVYVDFLPDEEFEKQVTSDRADLTDEDVKEIEQATGLMRALGLIEGDVDLFDTSNELNSKGMIGFYSYDDERLRVRGTKLTPAVQSVLVHELTHALQDQTFDLGDRLEELREADDANSSATAEGFDALVEGDARRIEGKWRDSLTEKQQKALDKEQNEGAQGFEAEAKGIPEVLKTMMQAPYDLGTALLAVAVEQGGQRAVDDLFRSPPSTEEQQLDPWTLIADHQGFLTVPAPELGKDEKEFGDGGAFGALGWLMVLAQRLPPKQALEAADGWGGDSYASYERDGVSCVRINYRGDTPQDLTQMQSALQAWTAKLPKAPVKLKRQDQTLAFQSCDPGKNAARVAGGKSSDALAFALTRTYLSLALVKQGAPVPVARCAAGRLVGEFSLAQLTAAEPKVDPRRVQQLVGPCREQV